MNKYFFLCVITILFGFGYCEENQPEVIVEKARTLIFNALQNNNQWQMYQSYVNYVSNILDKTKGTNWWNDKNGYFRLNTIDRWLRNPVDCIIEGEHISHSIHQQCQSGIINTHQVIQTCTELLDINIESSPVSIKKEKNPVNHINEQIVTAEQYVRDAFGDFSEKKLLQFIEITQRLTVREVGDIVAHSLSDRQTGLAMCSMADRVKMDLLVAGAFALCEIFESSQFESLKQLKPGKYKKVLVGSKHNDTYDIDKLKGISCIIDPGGYDTYVGGTTGPDKPVLVIIDFAGNDRYIAKDKFAQGSGFFGISILYDRTGNDTYEGTDVCQGTALMGIGILVDDEGDDCYVADRRGQGSAICGIGILIDRNGNDQYKVNLFGQGYGGMLGIGILEDSSGNDSYIAGGKYDEPYQEPPHYYKHAWSQGCGSGFRGISNGGFGIMLDGGGDDLYQADYFSTGGYWFAAGIARDFGGNDIRKPLTNSFTRYGFGYACHYAIGLLYDDTGNDTYIGTLGIQAFGWDIGTACVVDFAGDDHYIATISGQGFACQGSWAILIDGNGSDMYDGDNENRVRGIPGPLEYHPKNLVGGNFSFLIDLGSGADSFSCKKRSAAINNRSTENGAGYLMDID
ncbi:MAG TPA: hypothetical protein PL060_02270 [bacterium]|nr:hypothetical protein [bacterium]